MTRNSVIAERRKQDKLVFDSVICSYEFPGVMTASWGQYGQRGYIHSNLIPLYTIMR